MWTLSWSGASGPRRSTHFIAALPTSSERKPALRFLRSVETEGWGFDFASISDHYHPWLDDQGHAGFVWSVLGAIAARTERLAVGVGVTCPTIRIHPAILAQAVATTGRLFGGRFTWGVSSGENLNEHITAHRWPPADLRLEIRIAHRYWRTSGVPGQLSQDLATPALFEQAAEARAMGVDHIYFHQIGPHQQPFLSLWESVLRPTLLESDTLSGDRTVVDPAST